MRRILNAHQQSRGVHDSHPGGEPTQVRGGEGRSLRPCGILKEKPRDLVDHLEYGAGPDSEQYGRGEVGVGEAANPRPQHRGPPTKKRQASEVREVWPLFENGRCDAYTLRNVVQREPDHEERPGATSPRANAAPMASPSPRLCRPIPRAIRYDVESRLVSPRLLNNRSAPNSPRRASSAAISTRGTPEKTPGNRPATSTASSSVSTTSQTRSPSVRASTAPIPAEPRRRRKGYQSSPRATGITPT